MDVWWYKSALYGLLRLFVAQSVWVRVDFSRILRLVVFDVSVVMDRRRDHLASIRELCSDLVDWA